MEIKYLEDYFDEMSGLFPELEKSSLKAIMRKTSWAVTRYMRSGRKGFKIRGKKSAIEGNMNKLDSFIITRIFSPVQLFGLLKLNRGRLERKNRKDGNK